MGLSILTAIRPAAGLPASGKGKINGLAFTYTQRQADVLVTWCCWHHASRILAVNAHGERQTLETRLRQADARLPRRIHFTCQPTR
jgi:hypothetical protein